MKCAVYAATDLVLTTKETAFNYPKGAAVQVELTKDGDVLVVYHDLIEKEVEKDGKKSKVKEVRTRNIRFIRMEDLRFFLDSVVFGTQLSANIDFKDVPLSEAMILERLTPAHLGRYLNDAASPVQKSYAKDGERVVRVPIRPLEKRLDNSAKLNLLKTFNPLEKVDGNVHDVLTMRARQANNANKAGYLLAMEAITGPIESHLPEYLRAKLEASSPDSWRYRVIEGGIVKLDTGGALPRAVADLLKTLPVKTVLQPVRTGDATHYEVRITDVRLAPVVETYYTREIPHREYTLVEDDGSTSGSAPDDQTKEGDACKTKDGTDGEMKKLGDSWVCMVKEAYTPDMHDRIAEGDPIQAPDGTLGILKRTESGFAAVVFERQTVQHTEGFTTESDDLKEGDACGKSGLEGRIVRGPNGRLACEISSDVERTIFTVPVKAEAEFGGDGSGDDASPAEGDPCDFAGQKGTLTLLNGALICTLGDMPNGQDGAN